ncbi:MAG: hypothetical protein AAF639_17050 [Chloroflexota bacterium]
MHIQITSAHYAQITDANLRYRFVTAVWDRLQEADDPTEGAKPVTDKPGRYELAMLGYTLIFDLPEERPNDIDLLSIY